MYKFEKLEIWELALEQIDVVYKIAGALPSFEQANLGLQMRRAPTSVALNIAEGSTGQTDAEQMRFLAMALRSLLETVACGRLIERRGYDVEAKLMGNAYDRSHVLAKKIQAMRKAIKRNGSTAERARAGMTLGRSEPQRSKAGSS